MATRHLSLRIPEETFEELEHQSEVSGQPLSRVANTLLEEGVRMAAHPGIVFRPGPAGRRPALAVGPDIWEIARVFQDTDMRSEEGILRAARLAGLERWQIERALGYYLEYRDEIDAWIRREDAEAERAEAAWRRTRNFLEA